MRQTQSQRMAALDAAARRRAEIAALVANDPTQRRQRRTHARRNALEQWRLIKRIEARGGRVPDALMRSTLRWVDMAEGKETTAVYERGHAGGAAHVRR